MNNNNYVNPAAFNGAPYNDAYIALRTGKGGSSPSPGGGNGGGGFPGGGGMPAGGGSPASDISQNGSPMFDLFGTSSNYIIARQPAGQNLMSSYQVGNLPVIRYDLEFEDFSGGPDAQRRRIRNGVFTNELSVEQALAMFSRVVALPPLVTVDSSATNAVDELDAISSCYLNDAGTPRWLVAGGDVANKSLFSMAATLTAQTFTPGGNIVSLTTVKIATNTERVIVGLENAAAKVLTGFNGTPTTSGTMHANTSGCWGVIRTSLNSTTPGAENLLIYSNDSLYILSSTAAIGDAPTAVLTNWPGGGYAIGIVTLSTDNVARAYWVHPLRDLSVSMLAGGAPEPGKVVSTNLEGTDPKDIDMGLPFIIHALKWRNGIVATDGKQIIWNNGDHVNLGWNRERDWSDPADLSNRGTGSVQCLAVVGDRLFAATSFIAGISNYNVLTVWEEYFPETNTWHFYCKAVRAAGLLPNVAKFTGKTPVYQPHDTTTDAGVFWWYTQIDGGLISATYEWGSVNLDPSGINPYFNQEEGPWVTWDFATAGSITTPVYDLGGLPMVVSDVQYKGELNGTGSQVEIEIAVQTPTGMSFAGNQSAVFKEGVDWRRNWWVNPDPEGSIMDRLKIKGNITQATSGTYKTQVSPNLVPFRVGGYIYLDGVYRDPKSLEPERYWGDIE